MKKLILGIAILLASCNSTENQLSEITAKIEKGKYEIAIEDLKKLDKETFDGKLKEKIRTLFKDANDKLNTQNYNKMKANRQDELYLDFKFGMSESEVKSHATELIGSKKLDPYATYDFTMGAGAYAQLIKLEGYVTQFSPSDYSCTGLVSPNYGEEKLNKLEIILISYPENKSSDHVLSDVVKLFSSKYGKSKNIPNLYSADEKSNIKYYTSESNKAIYISEVAGIVFVVYEDLISRYETVDFLKNLKKDQENMNIENSKELQKNI